MSDWPERNSHFGSGIDGGFISTQTALMGVSATAAGSVAWPSASHAFFIPVRIPVPITVYKMSAGAGATAGTNNFDVGIYDRFGNRLVSSGATAKGNSVEHIIDVTDTRIGPGLYYLAMSADATGNYIMITPSGTSPVPLQKARIYGVLQMASAYTLPATATFAAASQSLIPNIGAFFRYY